MTIGNVIALVKRTLLPVGSAHYHHLRLNLHHKGSFESYDKHVEEEERKIAELNAANGNDLEDDLGVGDEPEADDLLHLDPKEWKASFFDDQHSCS